MDKPSVYTWNNLFDVLVVPLRWYGAIISKVMAKIGSSTHGASTLKPSFHMIAHDRRTAGITEA